MINVLPQGSGGGSVGLIDPDTDITAFPPWVTPIIRVAKDTRKITTLTANVAELDVAALDIVARDIGRAAIGTSLMCTEYSQTCEAMPRISPYATFGESLRFEDLLTVKELLTETLTYITKLEDARLEGAREHAEELVPTLEHAIGELGKRRQG